MQGIVRLCYRKTIDHTTQDAWDRAVFNATHLEFYMQAQRVDPEGRFATFKELIENIPEAQHLHYLVSSAAMGYIRLLKDVVPDIKNQLGDLCLSFHDFKFEIIQSHIEDKTMHTIAVSFYSDPVTWIETIGNHLLIAQDDCSERLRSRMEVETEMIAIVPKLSISHFCNTAS